MNEHFNYQALLDWHQENFESSLKGRYINQQMILPLIENLSADFKFDVEGQSVEHRDIHTIKWGNGPKRIMLWSQMHGNESSTTKALFDFFKWLEEDSDLVAVLKDQVQFLAIPMLSPDGAQRYTRLNAVEVDLNRDAQNLSQPESVVLRNVFNEFKPQYCFNLHGQRTIFSVNNPPQIATLSFLSPAEDAERSVTFSRKAGMAVINAMNDTLQQIIPGQVGRYDDSFNINCSGDTFQSLGAHTILFEAGHSANDYDRVRTRELLFVSYIKAFLYIANTNEHADDSDMAYAKIPQNEKLFYDIILREIEIPGVGLTDVAVQYEEKLAENEVEFIPKIAQIGELENFKGHKELKGFSQKILEPNDIQWEVGEVLEEITVNGESPTTFSLFLDK